MKKLLLLLTVLLIIAGCKNTKIITKFITDGNDPIPDQYIVLMKDSFEEPVIKNRKESSDRKLQKEKNKLERDKKEKRMEDFLTGKGIRKSKIISKFADIKVGALVKITASQAYNIKADANVEDVIQDISIQINPIQQTDPVLNSDPLKQWLSEVVNAERINPIQQSNDSLFRYDIDTVSHTTHAVITAGGPVAGTGKTNVIWFLDTGIDPDHPDLNVNSSLGASFINGITSPDDDNGHGTFCAGVAAGKPVGIAPQIHIGISEGATVVPVKVLDRNGNGSWGTVIAGLNFVAQLSQPGDVVNLSLGAYDASNPTCYFPGLRHAIERVTTSGVFVTLSAGNDAGNAECNRPGCINGATIFTASSINADRTCAGYANFGSPVDYVTVGTRVFSLWFNNGYRMASGTSISSALLAGIIHAKGGIPTSGSTVNCMGKPYTIARH